MLSILKKEQRGYITPDEFNKLATQVQLDIFENYFEDLNQQLRVPQTDNTYANRQKNIDNLFFLGQVPDPDILIRTGGYKRLSNFIMYNLTYTELFFTETLWPDFSEKEFNLIINQYLNINRKYGL